ncbi:hypothetical protein GQ53DRAFT_633848 [Thozetella sp. PMI_491]|nr:hypothetical protein GQ53DRAFT_633848 [Thozetella sp. PMI_491]
MGRSDFTRARVDDEGLRLRVESAITVPVGRSPKVNQVDGSDLLFGVSTTYSRLVYADNSLVKDWARWLTDGSQRSNGAGLVLTLNRGSPIEVTSAKEILQKHGIDAVVSTAEGDVAVRYADMVKLLKKQNDESKTQGRARKYLALLDDDIFFPSVGKLLQKLSKFNSEKEYYIGAPSERTDWVFDDYEAFTYGGGAVFLTVPLVDRLAQSTCLKDIIRDDEVGDQWDMMLYNCVSQTGDMELQVLPSFYNPEEEYLFGERGVIENEGYGGGLQALTLHHYKNTHRFEAGQGHLVTDICGEDCFLQRFLFKDDWVLVNGYSMTHYPEGVEAMSLKERLRTQQPREDHRTEVSNKVIIDAPDRPSDLSVVGWRGRRKTWRLLDSTVRENGEVWQAYVNRRGAGGPEFDDRKKEDILHEEEEKSDLDSLVVLIWEP